MEIKHFGLTSLLIKTKKTSVLIDPLSRDTGLKKALKKADIVCVSRPESPYYTTDKAEGAYLIDSPGEYEIDGIMIFGMPVVEEDGLRIVYYIYVEDIPVLHLGGLSKKPDNGIFDDLTGVDILALPVGGMFGLDTKTAKEVASALDPAFIIPMNYTVNELVSPLKEGLSGIDEFLKEMQVKDLETINKFKIKKNQIKADDQRKAEVVMLSPLV